MSSIIPSTCIDVSEFDISNSFNVRLNWYKNPLIVESATLEIALPPPYIFKKEPEISP